MNIRHKLSLQFSIIVVSILLVFTVSIYYFSLTYRRNDYNARLRDRAYTTARLFLNVKEVDENLLKIIDKNTLSLYQESVFIIDEQNKLLYFNSDKNFRDYRVLDKIKKNKIYSFKIGVKDAVGVLYDFNNHPYYIIAAAYDMYGIAKIKNLKIILIISFVMSVAISVFAGLVFAGRALKPISTVVDQVEQITITRLNSRLDEGNKTDEIARLAITFNQMLQRLEEAFVLQRDFVSNAAHELRTPFSVLLAEIEYCLLQDRDKEQYAKTIENLGTELKKLSRLSNSLLDLARISFDNYNFELKTIRVDELLIDTCNDIVATNSDYKLHMSFDNLPENDDLLNIMGNVQLLKIAVKNIIENACKFSESKTADIFLSSSNNIIELTVTDKGIGIRAEDLNNIFQPFFRGTNTQYISGFGLGLALCNKIVQLHNGKITVESELGVGSTFRVQLPCRQSI